LRRGIKLLVMITAVALLLAGFYAYLELTHPRCETVSVFRAKEMIDTDPSLVILDVRTEGEYVEGHIEGAINIPLEELEQRLDELDKERGILVYCRSGVRSERACEMLIEGGFRKVYNMEGGISAWMSAGYPIVARVKRSVIIFIFDHFLNAIYLTDKLSYINPFSGPRYFRWNCFAPF